MDSTQPLDEFGLRKQQLQSQLALYREELGECCETVVRPVRMINTGMQKLASNRLLMMGVLGASIGLFIVTTRKGGFKKIAAFIAPLVVPRVREFLLSRIPPLAMKSLQLLRQKRED